MDASSVAWGVYLSLLRCASQQNRASDSRNGSSERHFEARTAMSALRLIATESLCLY